MKFLVPFLVGLAPGFIIGAITGWFSHLCACKRDARNRLIAAKVLYGISIQKQIDAVPERHVLDFYNRTKADVRNAVITLRQEFGLADQICIDDLWDNYQNEVWKTINATEYKIPESTSKLLHEMTKTPYNPQSNQDRLKAALARFYEFSKT